MDKDRIKGKSEEIKGRIKRHVGEWIGGEKMRGGGRIQNAWSKLKYFGREIPERKWGPRTIMREEQEDSPA